ncbi:uncharacterized protein LOC131215567 [Anopheles bellator]|uniref:uncharacterized protein LOC131215567 n=1 Tax=Anopheles bellator TaxID=139047 RepID=UPI0026494374|nr:uncharacterized protein LOC131215567 [Anopheles bellator]
MRPPSPHLVKTPAPKPAGDASPTQQMSPQQDAMEQWVSDTFFSYFPSFNKKQKDQKVVLSRARQEEYQEYLKNVNFIANVIPEVATKHQQYIKKYGTGKTGKGAAATTGEGSKEKGAGTSSPPPAANVGMGNSPAQPQVRFGKSLVAEGNANFRKGSPREKLIEDLAHIDLPTILNTDTIDRRNRMLAEEESRRKMDYQRDLIKQIEEKRKEVERMREKEKLEEEMLTSRLEQQLKTMQLEEQLEHERVRSEKLRIANEQNHIRRLQLLANLENDHKLFNPYDGQRKAFSENGVKSTAAAGGPTAKAAALAPNSLSSGDERTKVYRYFSNSAQNEKYNAPPFASGVGAAYSSGLSSEQDYESSSETTINAPFPASHRYQFCKTCRGDIDRSFLPPPPTMVSSKHHPKATDRKHCANCKRIGAAGNDPRTMVGNDLRRCARCERTIKRSSVGKGSSLCAVCQLTKDAHGQPRRTMRAAAVRPSVVLDTDDPVEDSEAVNERETNAGSPVNPYKIIDVQYHESDNEHGDTAVLNPVIVKKNYRQPPYSLNISENSLFHPNKSAPEPVLSVNVRNGEVFVDNKLRSRPASPARQPAQDERDDESSSALGDDLLDERIAKYVRHYNTLWMKRGHGRKQNTHQPSNCDHHQTMTKNFASGSTLPSLSPPKVYVSDRPEKMKSDGLKLVEKKWEIPAVERTKVNNTGSTRVLTQLGAIRKQLQLEQLQMDGPSSYTKNNY